MPTEKKRKEGTGHGVDLQDRQKVEPPKKYKVVLHNDDFTPMEFVVAILMGIFQKNQQEATQIMLNVHQNGIGVAGVYTREIGVTKISQVPRLAQKSQFPLKCSLEKDC